MNNNYTPVLASHFDKLSVPHTTQHFNKLNVPHTTRSRHELPSLEECPQGGVGIALIALTMCTLLSTTLSSQAQTNAPWNRNGTSANNGDWLGTNNAQPLIFKTNTTEALRLKPNGEVVIKTLDLNSTTLNGLVLTNGQGKLERYNFTGLATQYLAGNGTWQTLPAANAWLTANNPTDIYKPTGNVGIGTQPSPFFKLDVIGDARISNNLYVGGGVIITDKVQAATLIKGLDFKVDNDLEVQNNTLLRGTTVLAGSTTVTGSININNNAYFNSPASFNTSTVFNNTATYNNILRATQGVDFENTLTPVSIKYNATNQTINYGRAAYQLLTPCGAGINSGINHQFGGYLQLFNPAGFNNTAVNGDGYLTLQTEQQGHSTIDAGVVGNNTQGIAGQGQLLINYYCGANTSINTGPFGGMVSMGKNVEIDFPYPQSLACALNVKGDVNYQPLNLTANHTQDWLTAAQINVNRDFTNALLVTNTKPTGVYDYTFRVMGSGLTTIGSIPSGQFGYAMLNVYTPSNNTAIQTYDAQGNEKFKVDAQGGAMARALYVDDATGKTNFKVSNNGRTEIGNKKSVTHFDAMLSVEGKVAAQSCFITEVNDWADFVFDTNYKLPSLYEVEKYYTAYHHLPLIPSAAEVKQNGMDVAQMNKLLL